MIVVQKKPDDAFSPFLACNDFHLPSFSDGDCAASLRPRH